MTEVKPKVFKKGGKQRLGKGFSREELKRAGLCPKEALRMDLCIDSRRKTAHEPNIAAIKTFVESKKPTKKPKKKSKS